MQDWYAAEAAKNEENGQNGQLKNVQGLQLTIRTQKRGTHIEYTFCAWVRTLRSRALHMSLCLNPASHETKPEVPGDSL